MLAFLNLPGNGLIQGSSGKLLTFIIQQNMLQECIGDMKGGEIEGIREDKR